MLGRMRTLILILPLLLASVREACSQASAPLPVGREIPGEPADSLRPEGNGYLPGSYSGPFSDSPLPAPAETVAGGLEGRVKGNQLILDWTAAARPPAEFRVLHPGGRMIASRLGKRSVQGWMSTVRVAGWPRGVYFAEVRSGGLASWTKFLLP
jgi:hypothetical protein